MDYRLGVDFLNTLEDAVFQLLDGSNTGVFEKSSRHFSKQRFRDIEQDPCVGVRTYLNRLGCSARYVSLER